MSKNNPTPTSLPDPAWLALGELLLPSGENPDEAIKRWLPEILFPLQLTEGFLNRVIDSAQESAARAIQAQAENYPADFLLSLFIPLTLSSPGTTWGYFSVLKFENPGKSKEREKSRINFYLYVEGE